MTSEILRPEYGGSNTKHVVHTISNRNSTCALSFLQPTAHNKEGFQNTLLHFTGKETKMFQTSGFLFF